MRPGDSAIEGLSRGDVCRLRLGNRQGHEQHGVRYGVIVQTDALMILSTVLVAPTSTSSRAASFRPEITINGLRTRVLVEQTGAVDISKLGRCCGRLLPQEQWSVDNALRTVLDLRQ